MKTFRLYFRYRDALGELFDAHENVQASSEKKAREMGKMLATQRAPEYSGKYWFNSVERLTP